MSFTLSLNQRIGAILFLIGIITASITYSHSHEGAYHGGARSDYYYHGGGGAHYHGDGYWGRHGYWGGPWYGPGVTVTVPLGGYYVAPPPVCSIVQRCYPNGTCVDYEVCE